MTDEKIQKPLRPFVEEIYAPLPDSTKMLRRQPGWVWSVLSVPLFLALSLVGFVARRRR